MSEDLLKIMAVSLMSNQKCRAYAVWNGEQLVITGVSQIPGVFGLWRQPLIDEIEDKKSKGWVVLVEEKTDFIASHGTQYLLEEVEDKSNLYDALDWYFALNDIGNIIADEEAKRYLIRAGGEGQRVEKKQDEKGRPYYSIDWGSFSGGHRVVLLCVVAALTEPVSERFLTAMYGEKDPEPEDDNPVRRWQRLIARRDLERGKQFEEEREGRGGMQ